MKTNTRTGRAARLPLAAAVFALFAWACWPVVADEPEVVGALALALQDQVAKKLNLTEGQKEKLRQLIDQRESEAIELHYLPEAERGEKLAAFRKESETKGLALLSPEQRALLQQVGQGRLGAAMPAATDVTAATPAGKPPLDGNAAGTAKPLGPAKPPGLTKPAGPAMPTGPAKPSGPEKPPGAADEEKTKPATAADQPAPGPAEPPAAMPRDPSGKVRFNFRYQPWKEVIDWFAQQADLSLVMETPPQGTFNYSDERQYTPGEAIDLLNSVLLTKGYTLVRKDRMLMLVNLQDGIPPNLVSRIRVEQLDSKGDSEVVSVVFQLDNTKPEDVEPEVKKLIGPQGSVVALTKSRQLQVTETAGRLREIRGVIQRIEDPTGLASGQTRVVDLKNITPQQILPVLRQLLDIPEEKYATADGSLRLALDPTGQRLLVSGKPEMMARVAEILKVVDVAGPNGAAGARLQEEPQLEVYSITTADPDGVLAVMQTLLAGQPDVRLTIDVKTGNLVALARPSDHKTIRATLEQMQREARHVEVIQLRTVDPQLAVLSINKLFGSEAGKATTTAPQVDADPISRQLLVRATSAQIDQIRTLLKKMGESDAPEGSTTGGNVRMVPIKGRSAQAVLKRLEEIWPSMRQNPIRIVTPSAVVPSVRPDGDSSSSSDSSDSIPSVRMALPRPAISRYSLSPAAPAATATPSSPTPWPQPGGPPVGPPWMSPGGPWSWPQPQGPPGAQPGPGPTPGPPQPRDDERRRERDKQTSRGLRGARAVFAAVASEEAPLADDKQPPVETAPSQPAVEEGAVAPQAPQPTEPAAESPPTEKAAQPKPPATIIVAPGPGGIMIASEDPKALDELEQLLKSLAGDMAAGGPELTIFYLRHAKAANVAETLDQIFGGGTLVGESSGGGSLIGDLAGAALGGGGGGILGTLLGGGGGSGGSVASSASLRITSDSRLNALIVQGNPVDIDAIEQLLKILDQKQGPEEILVAPKAKRIPVVNTQAQEIADIVKQVFQDRMIGAGAAGGQRPPSPEEFIQMLRGGGGRRGGASGRRNAAEEAQKMTVSVDARTNSIIVVAPEPLLDEVSKLVAQLDQAAAVESDQSMKVVTLHKTSPQAVEAALSALMGDTVRVGRSGQQGQGGPSGQSPFSGRQFGGSQSPFQGGFQPQFQQFQGGPGGGNFGGRGGGRGGFGGRGGG